jgi:hypothetical protein
VNLKKINFIYFIPTIILTCLLLFLLYWRQQVGLHRFFDVDEFSYLHWAANVARGQRPYTDFFLFVTPGFMWFFAPLIALFSFQSQVFVAARMVSLGIFTGMLALLGTLFALTREKRWATLPVVLLAFLPMPYDKFMEIRPDNLSTLLALGGLVLEVLAIRAQKLSKPYWFWSGVCYMVSLLIFAKTIPFVAVGVGIALLYVWWVRGTVKSFPEIIPLGIGLVVPLGIFSLWLLTLGDIGKVWYSLVKLPFEANMLAKYGWMEPNLFFFPNGSFYGGTTHITLGLILNHAVWITGVIVGSIRFITPFIAGAGDKRKTLIELLIGGIFIVSVFGYMQFFPLKHSQYLIPIAIFIAYYCADALVLLFRFIDRKLPLYAISLILIIGSYYIGQATIQVNQVKLGWSNDVQLTQMDILLKTIPPKDEVLDLEGRVLFWKDAYYICCVPFGTFVPFMSRQPPVLRDVLETKKTPYIFQGDSNRLSLLTVEDQQYIRTNYIPAENWGDTLWVRKPM